LSTAGDRPLLGIDTATPRSGIALVLAGDPIAEIGFQRSVSPSRWLLPSIRLLLDISGVSLPDLAALAVTVGPGSFTGLRVGLATVQGLAMASGTRVAGISTLAALAETVPGATGLVAPWLDAGRGEVYAGLRRGGDEVTPEGVARPEEVLQALPSDPIRFVGNGAGRYLELIRRRPGAHPGDGVEGGSPLLAAAAARLGARALQAGNELPARPRYLRAPDALRARA
jgi:tRNA threonylcarbamoyladenosine biosynthesis protein TsaB